MSTSAQIMWWVLGAVLIFAAVYVVAEIAATVETAHFHRVGL